jgi:hypothetical protein
MASEFNDNIFSASPKLLDAKWGPFESEDAAWIGTPELYREIGMFAIIARPNSPAELYWYKNGTKNEDLVPFTGNSSVQVYDVKNQAVPPITGQTFFPPEGSVDVIYIDKSTFSSYYWDLSTTPPEYAPTGTVQVYPKLLPDPTANPPDVPGIHYFPLIGEENIIYVADNTDIAYTWNVNISSYVAISKGSIDLVDNTGLEFDGENKLKTVYNTLIADGRTSQIIGQLTGKLASYWKTKNIVEVLNEILFPLSLPDYTPTTILLEDTLALPYYEIGTSITNNLTLSARRNDAGNYSNLSLFRKLQTDADFTPINSVNSPPFTLFSGTNRLYSISYSDVISVAPGITTWTGNGDYASGIVKTDTDGNPDTRPAEIRQTDAPQAAENDFDSNDVTINGIYPYYYGYSSTQPTLQNIADLIQGYTVDTPSLKKVLRPLSDGEQVIFGPTVFSYLWIAHTGTSKNTYITSTQSTETEIGTGSSSALFPTKQTRNFTTTAWTNIQFNVYISGYDTLPINAGSQIWFKFLN